MALEISSALIPEMQLELRRDAGIPSYDPADPSLPPLPSIHDVVSSIDPSLPPDHRCSQCRGPLLHGPASTVCIFCGADRRREAPVKTVSFSATAGCRKLLGHLGLDGSETVILDPVTSDSSKGQEETKEGLLLSSLLNLELSWPLERGETDSISTSTVHSQMLHAFDQSAFDLDMNSSEIARSNNSTTSKVHPQNSNALNLSGVDLDSFFSDTNKESTPAAASLSGEPVMPNSQGNETLASQNLGFLRNFQSSNAEISSINAKENESGDSFAAWEADFQSASSDTFAGESKSSDIFGVSSPSEFPSSATTTATFSEQTNEEYKISIGGNNGKAGNNEGQFFSSASWIQDDIWSQMTEVVSSKDLFKSGSGTNNGELTCDLNHMTSKSQSLAEDELRSTSTTQENNRTEIAYDNEDSLDDWQGFTGSIEVPGSLSNSLAQNGAEIISTKESNNTRNIDNDDDLFDAWQEFTSSSEAQGDLLNSWTKNDSDAVSSEHYSVARPVVVQDIEFDSFLQSDPFSGLPGSKNGSGEVGHMEFGPTVSDRTNEKKGKSETRSSLQGDFNIDGNSTGSPNAESSKSTVEKLLSQMRDLSFMLESNLSVPEKVDGFDALNM